MSLCSVVCKIWTDPCNLTALFAIRFNLMAFNDSNASFREVCMIGGNASAAAFIGDNSTYFTLGNYIENLETTGCQEPGPRLFKEEPGARCFNGGTNCTGTCEEMSEATECAVSNSTMAPSQSPSPAGTPVPSVAPISTQSPAPAGTLAPSVSPVVEPTFPIEEPISPPSNSPVTEPSLSPIFNEPTTAQVGPPPPSASQPTPMHKPYPRKLYPNQLWKISTGRG